MQCQACQRVLSGLVPLPITALAACWATEIGPPSTGGLAINEVLAPPEQGETDWVEPS